MSNAEIPMTAAEQAQRVLEARRAEVAQYDENIAMYEAIASTLPSEWPEHLLQHKGTKNHQAAAAQAAPEDVELLAQLLMREQCEASAKTEKLERTKAAAILAVLESRQP